MTDLSNVFLADKGKLDCGTWVPLLGTDGEIKVAGFGNEKQTAFLKSFRRQARQSGGEVPESIEEEGIARCVLLDWRNIQDGGVTLDPTVENKLMLIRKYPQFKSIVITASMDWATFERDAMEQEAKNSPNTPSGSSDTDSPA